MIYVTLDTCVWLGLLKVDYNNDDNFFEEICFWFDQNGLRHITPTNILDEWNRNKTLGKEEAVKNLKEHEHILLNNFKNDSTLSKIYNPDNIAETIQKRIERIDLILNTSEKALICDDVLIEAGKRNLNKLAPNHIKEGYRDTVNILTLINHLKSKGYERCLFTTIDGDFGQNRAEKYTLHSSLVNIFKEVKLQYIYFGNKKNISDNKNSFGATFFNELRKDTYSLPVFQEYLKEKKREETAKELEGKKPTLAPSIENPDIDYLDNIKYIDIILGKKIPTAFEQQLIKSLIERHDSYKQYFFNNIGSNGLV